MGTPQGFFKSSQGLHQGDPISPALFVISAEVLSRFLNSMISQRDFMPFRVAQGCPIITHLAYADDIMIFWSGMKRSLKLVMKVLEDFAVVSG